MSEVANRRLLMEAISALCGPKRPTEYMVMLAINSLEVVLSDLCREKVLLQIKMPKYQQQGE